MAGHGHGEVDFAVLLLETARDAGMQLRSEGVSMSDGLEA
jgi:3-hydroxyisobutyrate dehydrogenase